MPWGVAAAAIGAGGAIGGGFLGSQGAKDQVRAMREAIDLDRRRYEETKQRLNPFVKFGTNQIGVLDDFLKNEDPSNFIDPGYTFRKTQGVRSMEGSAAANNTLLSGDTLRGLEEYGQDMASQEYGNAFNRYLSKGNFLQNLAGMGQSAAAGLGYLGAQSSANIANATANTDFGAPDRIWGNVISGLGGIGGNALNKYFAKSGGTPSIPGGSNIFKSGTPANDVYSA